MTPPYFRAPTLAVPEVIRAANRLSDAASRRYGYWRDGRFESLFSDLADKVPRFLWGAPQLGDMVLHMPFDAVRPKLDRKTWSFRLSGLIEASRDVSTGGVGGMFASLYGEVTEETHVVKRGFVRVSRNLRASRWDLS